MWTRGQVFTRTSAQQFFLAWREAQVVGLASRRVLEFSTVKRRQGEQLRSHASGTPSLRNRSSFCGSCFVKRLEGEVTRAEALDVVELLVELVEVPFLVIDQRLE